MTWHRGRLVDHVHLRATDLELSRQFYTGALGALGLTIERSGEEAFFADELYVSAADPKLTPTHIHLAFQARDRDTVDAFHKAALAAGGSITVPLASARIIRAITPALCWTRTATTSKPFSTARAPARQSPFRSKRPERLL